MAPASRTEPAPRKPETWRFAVSPAGGGTWSIVRHSSLGGPPVFECECMSQETANRAKPSYVAAFFAAGGLVDVNA